MRDDIRIRRARGGDAPEISVLIHGVAHFFTANQANALPQRFANSITPLAIARHIGDDRFNCLTAWSSVTLAGVIAMRDRVHVHHLFVAPSFQRRGIATRLWEHAKADAVAAGNDEGFSVRSSEYAVPVYERFGFRVAGERVEEDGIVFVPMRMVLRDSHG